MKYNPSIAFDEMSGSAKGVTAAKNRGRKYIRNRGYVTGTGTSSQSVVKSLFKMLSQKWKTLTNDQILAWNALALTQEGKHVLGTASKISGSNLFSRLNFWVVKCGGSLLEDPPTLEGVDSPEEATVSVTADAITFTLSDVPDDVTNLKLVIMASPGQSNGVTSAYSKAVQIGDVRDISTEAYDITSDYEDTHGSLTEATPKVFFKYFFVNTSTGEKSGEMLVSGILS